MCGIVAYIGKKEAYPIVLKGLKRLEYRGYDSAGVALLNNGNLNIYKRAGKVSALEEYANQFDVKGNAGVNAGNGYPAPAKVWLVNTLDGVDDILYIYYIRKKKLKFIS